MCLFTRDGKTLLSKGYDTTKDEHFYRVLGGGLEFYELAEDGIRREIREELESEIENLKFLGIVENPFVYLGQRGHDIVFMYSGDLARKELYAQENIQVTEQNQIKFTTEWIPVEKIVSKEVIVYPTADYSKYLA